MTPTISIVSPSPLPTELILGQFYSPQTRTSHCLLPAVAATNATRNWSIVLLLSDTEWWYILSGGGGNNEGNSKMITCPTFELKWCIITSPTYSIRSLTYLPDCIVCQRRSVTEATAGTARTVGGGGALWYYSICVSVYKTVVEGHFIRFSVYVCGGAFD